jgi:hypothetical protein
LEFNKLKALRISELETRQSQMENKLFWVNLAIAVGTSVAAIYYIIEIVKFFYSYFHQF